MSDNQFNTTVNSGADSTVSKSPKKKKDVQMNGVIVLEKPSRILPQLVEELLEKNIPVRLTKGGYSVGGFYGLGDVDSKGFAFCKETNQPNTLVFFDNKGREHLVESFEDLVKFNNSIWGVFFKLSDDYKKPDFLWFQYMLQYGVLSITPGNTK